MCILYILLTQSITYLACKDCSRVLCTHDYARYVCTLINISVKNYFEISTKNAQDTGWTQLI